MHNLRNLDFTQFYKQKTIDGHQHLFIRPGITLTFFLDEPLAVTCNAVAGLVEWFFSVIPSSTLRSYLANNGYYKPLTDRQIMKDLRALRDLPPGYEGFTFNYSEAEFGQVGTYAIFFKGLEPSPGVPNQSNLVRLELPEDIVGSWGETRVLQLVTEAAECLPFFSGHVGLAFKRSSASEMESLKEIIPLLTRYLGFDPSDDWIASRMRGYASTPHWINLLGPQLTEILGGREAIATSVGQAETKALRNGTWIRGARLPPVGDVNRGATDIGQLPNVARLLRPVRCPNPRFGRAEFDILGWLARFDDLLPRDWDNS